MLIDTHAHLWFPDFDSDLEEVLSRAKTMGVERMVVPGTDVESSRLAVELARKYAGVIHAAVGVHPEETTSLDFQIPNNKLLTIIAENRKQVVGVGEIGTDASSEELRDCMGEQKKLFRAQCELAQDHDLPVIIHTRNSLGETLEVLDSLAQIPRGQFHCFSHDEVGLSEVLERGFYVSFAGNITWSKRVAKLVSLVPDDKLLLETDSPLMVPRDSKGVPLGQGERNEPGNTLIMAEKIAQLRGQSTEKVAEMTTINANRLFRL